MRITRLAVRDLRMHRDLDLDLAPGLTVVRGPNESGKTTLQRAIELALFRRVTSADAELASLRPWGGADEARPRVRLEFVQEELDGEKKGSIEKDFRGARGTVRLEYDGKAWTDPVMADEFIAELTGIPGEKFFRSTASIRHHEVDDLARDEGALRDRLQASISGADRGTSAAKRQLERALHELETQGTKNPGRLKVAEGAVARTEAVVAAGEAQLVGLERDRDALVVARDRRSQAEATLAERRSLLEKARQAERLAAEREVARERFERYRTAVAVSEQIATLEGAHPSQHALPVLRQIAERLRGLDRDIGTLRAQLGEGPQAVEYDIRIPEPRYKPFAWLSLVLAIGGVVVAGYGSLAGQLPFVVGGAASAAVAFLLAWYARARRRAAFDLRRQKQLREDEIARRLRGRSLLEDDLRRKEADFKAQLAGLDLPDLAAAEDLLAREEAHVQEIARARAQLDGLVGKEPVEALGPVRDAAALEIEQKTGALEALGPIAREPRARERLEVEVRDCEAALERARDDEAAARARVEQNPVDAEQVALEAERLAAWREELAALRRKARVERLALEAITRAEQATMRRATRYLERRMRGDLERLTDGRYRRVRVNDATLDVAVFSPERGDWVSAEALSQGTLDQVYLAARLGLVRLVTGDCRPPLVLDDPFVTFDDDRAARAFEVLRALTPDLQVIYLTCTDRYDALADRVVSLPAPLLRDAGPVEDEAEEGVVAPAGAARGAARGAAAKPGAADPARPG